MDRILDLADTVRYRFNYYLKKISLENINHKIRFKRTMKYDYKTIGEEIYKKLQSNDDLNILEFKQMIIAIEHMSYVYDIKDANFLKESIYNMIFDCYALTCEEKDKNNASGYCWSNLDHEFTISNSKDLKLSEIALLTKQKYYKVKDDGHMDIVV